MCYDIGNSILLYCLFHIFYLFFVMAIAFSLHIFVTTYLHCMYVHISEISPVQSSCSYIDGLCFQAT